MSLIPKVKKLSLFCNYINSNSFFIIKKFIVILFLLLTGYSLLAQNIYLFDSKTQKAIQNPVISGFLKKNNPTKDSVTNFLIKRELTLYMYSNGFLDFNVDTMYNDTLKNIKLYMYLGSQYFWKTILADSLPKKILKNIKNRQNNTVSPHSVYSALRAVLNFYENNGYPFAQIGFDSIKLKDDSISAKIIVHKKSFHTIDSIIIKGNAKINKNYIYQLIDIFPNSVYCEKKIHDISKILKTNSFLVLKKPPEIRFSKNYTKLYLYLDKKNANSFDGILGLMPSNDINKSLSFTGQLKFSLVNSIKKGEKVNFEWKKTKPRTQNLDIQLHYPFLFKSKFGTKLSFCLYKNDTIYLTNESDIFVTYRLKNGFTLISGLKRFNSRLLSSPVMTSILPDYANISKNVYSLGIEILRLDNIFIPTQGIHFISKIGLGNKHITKDNTINESLYDNIELNTQNLECSFFINTFISVYNRHVFKNGFQFAWINSINNFANELYRLGGLHTLRGFDDESILASGYGIYTFEYRFLLEKSSYLFLFSDVCYYDKYLINNYTHDLPLGFGGGITFDAKIGVFSVTYALGKQFDNPIQFQNSKIHFGYINTF